MNQPVMQWYSVIPFAMLLICIATFPLIPYTKKLFHHTWFQLLTALTFGLPVGIWMWMIGLHGQVVDAMIGEYFSFITLLTTLFVIAGGIFITGDIEATPLNNLKLLAIGTGLASFIGTTGAAMLMIKPVINTNSQRKNVQHIICFFILSVANCGGLLTPLGDPPLFLGYLYGVPFWWTMNLIHYWVFINGLVLLIFYALDREKYADEKYEDICFDRDNVIPVTYKGILGKHNFLLLGGVIASVLFTKSVDLDAIHDGTSTLISWIPIRELVMIGLSLISYFTTSRETRYEKNKFEWGPILEVGALFIGIFLAMIPALIYLAQIAPSLPLDKMSLFMFTGIQSAVLDNAPTYAAFFTMASELPGEVRIANVPEAYLISISLGAVFCGAITYIGNGPNLMVKAIAEKSGIHMPSFATYTLKYAFRHLIRPLFIMMLIFLSNGDGIWYPIIGLIWLGFEISGEINLIKRNPYPNLSMN